MHMRCGFALALAVALGAAVSAATFKAVWKSPEIGQVNYAGKKIAALVVSDDFDLRMSAEEALARELTDRGADGVAAYRLIPKEELRDKTKVKGWFERADVKSLVVMRLVSSKKEVTYSPVFWTTSYYGSMWDYYGYAWDSIYAPGYTTIDRVLTIETLIYGVANGHLLWASMSEKTNPKGVGQLASQLVKDLAKEMRKQGLVPSGSK